MRSGRQCIILLLLMLMYFGQATASNEGDLSTSEADSVGPDRVQMEKRIGKVLRQSIQTVRAVASSMKKVIVQQQLAESTPVKSMGIVLGTSTVNTAYFSYALNIVSKDKSSTVSVNSPNLNTYVFGDSAAILSQANPACAVSYFKKMFGMNYEDLNNFIKNNHLPYTPVSYYGGGKAMLQLTSYGVTRTMYPEDLTSLVLARERQLLLSQFPNSSFTELVTSLPQSMFKQLTVNKMVAASKVAGFTNVTVVSELDAIVSAISRRGLQDSNPFMVFKFDGGFLDMCMTQFDPVLNRSVVVPTSISSSKIGGFEIDTAMINYILDSLKSGTIDFYDYVFGSTKSTDPSLSTLFLQQLREICKAAKEELSEKMVASIEITNPYTDQLHQFEINRYVFQYTIIQDIYKDIKNKLKTILTLFPVDKYVNIYLVGGSTYIPSILQLIDNVTIETSKKVNILRPSGDVLLEGVTLYNTNAEIVLKPDNDNATTVPPVTDVSPGPNDPSDEEEDVINMSDMGRRSIDMDQYNEISLKDGNDKNISASLIADAATISTDNSPIADAPPKITENLSQIADAPPIIAENSPIADAPPIKAENSPIADAPPIITENIPTADAPPKIRDNSPLIENSPPIIAENLPPIENSPPIIAENLPPIEDSPPIITEESPIADAPPKIRDNSPSIADQPPAFADLLPSTTKTPHENVMRNGDRNTERRKRSSNALDLSVKRSDKRTSTSLGVATTGGEMNFILNSTSVLPTKNKRLFTTSRNDQTEISAQIYEGRSHYTLENNYITSLELQGLPARPQGDLKVEVSFVVDVNEVVTVKIVELNSKVENSISFPLPGPQDPKKIKEYSYNDEMKNLAKFNYRKK